MRASPVWACALLLALAFPGYVARECGDEEFQPDPTNICRFYHCAHGVAHMKTCGRGTKWNQVKKSCADHLDLGENCTAPKPCTDRHTGCPRFPAKMRETKEVYCRRRWPRYNCKLFCGICTPPEVTGRFGLRPDPPRLNEPLTVRCYQVYKDDDTEVPAPETPKMKIQLVHASSVEWLTLDNNEHTYDRYHNGLAAGYVCSNIEATSVEDMKLYAVGAVKKQVGLELKVEYEEDNIVLNCTMYQEIEYKKPGGTITKKKVVPMKGVTYVLNYEGQEVGADGIYKVTDAETKCGEITCKQGHNSASFILPKECPKDVGGIELGSPATQLEVSQLLLTLGTLLAAIVV